MTGVEADQLREAVQNRRGGTATLAQSIPVRETVTGRSVWRGVVHVGDRAGHPTTARADAWPWPIEGSGEPRRVAVLRTDRINAPLQAVRAASVARARAQKK
jgi:hypothetical protein